MEDFGWPWSKLEPIGDTGVFVGGNKILTRFERGWVEHFWFRGTTLFRKVDNIENKDHTKISRLVYNTVLPLHTRLMLLDYKHKKKIIYEADDFHRMKEDGSMKVDGDQIILPLTNIEDYLPDKQYREFNN